MIISRAPLRISFFGGGTDYPEHFIRHGGAVLATAIDKYSYVTASPFQSQLFDYSIRLSYRKGELVKTVDEIEHNVFRECLKYCGLDRDIELHNVADLPAFTGLGSSSTFTVSLLHVLHKFKGEDVSAERLAYEAIHIERNLLKDNVGCQDQTLAAFGGFNLVEFRAEDNILVQPVQISSTRMQDFQDSLFIVYTGITRKASDVIVKQIERIGENKKTLARMRGMVDKGWEILTGNQSLDKFGELLDEAWVAKRSLDSNVSNPIIDQMYEIGIKNGALGGKLLGAGGGGFILFFAPPEAHAGLEKAFKGRHIIKVSINSLGSEVIFQSDNKKTPLNLVD